MTAEAPRRARLPILLGSFVALLATFLLLFPLEGQRAQAEPGDPNDPTSVITEESYFARLYFLASDALQGRDTPSQGLEVAAAYLASEHMRMGLEPAAGEGSYYQRWPFRRIASDVRGAALTVTSSAGTIPLALGTGTPMRGGADGELSGELHFLANQTGAPPQGSLQGRWVVTYVPGTFAQPWLQRLNQANAWAEVAGAHGSIVVVEAGFSDADMAEVERRFSAGVWRQGLDLVPPQVVIRRDEAERAIPGFGALADRASAGNPVSEALSGARVSGQVPAAILVDGNPANVVAVLPGSDPVLRNEYVVLSAHYDHVGIGTPMNGDSIYNGADDNASGTVALLEVARALAGMETAPRRSVMFVHVSGEEKGLLGARWFVDHPPVPIEQMVANINADMVGGDAHRDTLVVIGKDYSTLGPLVDGINDGMPELGLITSDDLWPEQRFFFRSDQFHFMRKEIPSLFFFTGVHECYHRPCDTPQFVNANKAARISRLLAHSVMAIANADERPEWNPEGLAEVRALTGGGR